MAEERKNSKLIEDKLLKTQELWSSFMLNDDMIRAHHGNELGHLYFTEDLYGQVENLYVKFREILAQKKSVLEKSAEKEINVDRDGPSTSVLSTEVQQLDSTNQKSIVPKEVIKSRRSMASLRFFINDVVLHGQAKEYYIIKKQHIEKKWSLVQHDNLEVCCNISNPEAYNYDIDEIYAFEQEVQEILIKLEGKLKQSDSTIYQSQNRLPAISIPKFDGDLNKWLQFKDLFTEMVHKQVLSNAERMWYLKSTLQGEAEKLLSHLLVSDNSYEMAWKILNDRYENKRLLVATLIDKFIMQPNVVPGSSKALKQMHDITKECILSLENMDLQIDGVWDPILLHILSKKLDKDTQALYEQSLECPK